MPYIFGISGILHLALALLLETAVALPIVLALALHSTLHSKIKTQDLSV